MSALVCLSWAAAPDMPAAHAAEELALAAVVVSVAVAAAVLGAAAAAAAATATRAAAAAMAVVLAEQAKALMDRALIVAAVAALVPAMAPALPAPVAATSAAAMAAAGAAAALPAAVGVVVEAAALRVGLLAQDPAAYELEEGVATPGADGPVLVKIAAVVSALARSAAPRHQPLADRLDPAVISWSAGLNMSSRGYDVLYKVQCTEASTSCVSCRS